MLNSLCLSRVPIDDTSMCAPLSFYEVLQSLEISRLISKPSRDITISFPGLRILDISWCDKIGREGLRLIGDRLTEVLAPRRCDFICSVLIQFTLSL